MPENLDLPFKIAPTELSLFHRFVLREFLRQYEHYESGFGPRRRDHSTTGAQLSENLGISPDEASSAIRELTELGYIEKNVKAHPRSPAIPPDSFVLNWEALSIVECGFRVKGKATEQILELRRFRAEDVLSRNAAQGPDPLSL